MFSSLKLFQTAQNQLDHNQLFSLINSLYDGFLAIGQDGQIVIGNSAALNLLDANHLEGQSLAAVLPLVNSQGAPIDIVKAMPDPKGTYISRDFFLKRTNAPAIQLQITISPVKPYYKDTRIGGYVMLFREINAAGPASSEGIAKTSNLR